VTFSVRFAPKAEEDLVRLYAHFLLHDHPDKKMATRALGAIRRAIDKLKDWPFNYRKVSPENPFLREIVIPFGSAGYVALYEIESNDTVTVLAVRHQREDDYF
jgi:plasmid stabilization system protein ParE